MYALSSESQRDPRIFGVKVSYALVRGDKQEMSVALVEETGFLVVIRYRLQMNNG